MLLWKPLQPSLGKVTPQKEYANYFSNIVSSSESAWFATAFSPSFLVVVILAKRGCELHHFVNIVFVVLSHI